MVLRTSVSCCGGAAIEYRVLNTSFRDVRSTCIHVPCGTQLRSSSARNHYSTTPKALLPNSPCTAQDPAMAVFSFFLSFPLCAVVLPPPHPRINHRPPSYTEHSVLRPVPSTYFITTVLCVPVHVCALAPLRMTFLTITARTKPAIVVSWARSPNPCMPTVAALPSYLMPTARSSALMRPISGTEHEW